MSQPEHAAPERHRAGRHDKHIGAASMEPGEIVRKEFQPFAFGRGFPRIDEQGRADFDDNSAEGVRVKGLSRSIGPPRQPVYLQWRVNQSTARSFISRTHRLRNRARNETRPRSNRRLQTRRQPSRCEGWMSRPRPRRIRWLDDGELQPGNVLGGFPWRLAHEFANNRRAVRKFPCRSDKMASHRLAFLK